MTDLPTYKMRGLYFEEFQLGEVVVSAARTITEADIVNFAALSGDTNADPYPHSNAGDRSRPGGFWTGDQ